MRIAIDARYLTRQYSGIGMYSERLLEHLALQDRESEYFCLVQPDYSRPLALGENFHLIRYNARPLSMKTLFSVHRVLKRIRPDFFHCLFPIMPVFYRDKLLVTVHDLQPLMMREWTGRRFLPVKKMYDLFYRWIYPHTFNRSSWIIAVSQATKDALGDLMPELMDKTIVVHSGLDPEACEPPNPNTFDSLRKRHDIPERFLLYIGSSRPNKNVPNMLRAFSLLLERRGGEAIGFVLVLTRDRFLADITHTIRELGLESSIRILNPVSQAEKYALYHNAEIYFFATKLEGFGFPVLESQAQGTPVVASYSQSLPEVAGDAALLVDPDSPDEMARALERLLSDQTLRNELVERGKRNAAGFSWENTAAKVLEIYHHLM